MTQSWQEVWQIREKIYAFLGNCLLEPIQSGNNPALSQETWRNFPVEAANEHMKAGLEKLLKCIASLESLPAENAIEEVLAEYTGLFIGPGIPKAPLWESLYRTEERLLFGWTALEVREALNLQGWEIVDKDRQPEDHLGYELMFLAASSQKLQDTSLIDQHSQLIRNQVDFINRHLLSWIPELCRDAENHGRVGFCGGLIELIWGILLWDKELLEEYSGEENLDSVR